VSEIREMKISQIQHAGDTQIRVQLDLYAVEDYARAMRDGEAFPPVDVFFDDDNYWLADGFHRIEASEQLGKTTISANVHQGSKRDAILFAIDTNRRYGVRLKNQDKQKMVKMFLEDEIWQGWSNVEIANKCGVDQSTVKRHRDSIICIAKDAKPKERKATRNGKTYTINTENIGKPAEPKPELPQNALFEAQPQPEPEPAPITEQPLPAWAQGFDENTEPEIKDEEIAAIVTPQPKPEAEPIVEVAPVADVAQPEPVKPTYTVSVINADSQYLSQKIETPVHLVVTSPPYNVGIDYGYSVDNLLTYIPLITTVWRECYKVMADGARIAVVVPFGVGRNPYIPFDCQIVQTLVNAGFQLRGRIVWDKNTTGNRTSWGSFRLPSDPSIRDTTECIIVAHKGQSKLELPNEVKLKDEKGTYTEWLADVDEFMGMAQDHWVIAPESAQRVKHPAPFPVELAKRLIRFYAYPGAHVLDPFGGSGSVGLAAQELGCHATLIEISQQYCELAKGRLGL